MKGILAEGMYLERNPHWGYVKSPNASQHDLYARLARPGRNPLTFTAQVKTHTQATPSVYARDMVKDWRSNRFLVPDDHVAGLKEHWRQKISDLKNEGRVDEVAGAKRQRARIRGLGFDSAELASEFDKAGRYELRGRQFAYVSVGAAFAMALGPDLLHLVRNGSFESGTGSRWIRSGAVITAGGAASYSLRHIAKGAWQGTWKGNALVGTSLAVVDGWFAAQERGGFQTAFTDPTYYYRMAGSVSGTALALVVGGPVAVWTTAVSLETGLAAPVIGGVAGIVSGGVAYVVGQWGGESGIRWIRETTSPQTLHQAELTMVEDVQKSLLGQIASLQNRSTSSLTSSKP